MILGEPIILGGGGGIVCVVIITTDPSALVTATLENTSISKTANADGKAVFELKKAGVWTITASLNGETASTEIDTSLSLETELSFVSPILENNSWETISKVAREGKASQIWSVGDTKSFVMDGVTYKAQIIGFDHDNVANSASYGRAKAGITFQFKETYGTTVAFNSSSQQTVWVDSNARTTIRAWFASSVEEGIRNSLVEVVKQYDNKSEGISSATETGFLLSSNEYFNTKPQMALNNLGTQYAFYAAGNSPAKIRSGYTTYENHWTRSKALNDMVYTQTHAVYVNQSGSYALSTTTTKHFVAPAFCV